MYFYMNALTISHEGCTTVLTERTGMSKVCCHGCDYRVTVGVGCVRYVYVLQMARKEGLKIYLYLQPSCRPREPIFTSVKWSLRDEETSGSNKLKHSK